jgi:8-amino-7-oxononanoate synthase
MPDFTSALYLGFRHGSGSLRGWSSLTTGKPSALEETPGAEALERELAELVGCERALLGPSTLHLFWDLFALLAKRRACIFVDAAAYPISRWGATGAVAGGARVASFPAYDAGALSKAIGRTTRPVIVTDGFSPGLGRPAPLADYLELAEKRGGLLIVDDTQALGIFGGNPGFGTPWGSGGGGSLRLAGLSSPRAVLVSSLGKAFGVPVAMLAGNTALVAEFAERSLTRMHCSQASAADVAAASNALAVNHRHGDRLRRRLLERILRLREGLGRLGMIGTAGWFPVQRVRLRGFSNAMAVHKALLENGVRTLLLQRPNSGAATLTFVVNAKHRREEIDRAIACLGFFGAGKASAEGEIYERTIHIC